MRRWIIAACALAVACTEEEQPQIGTAGPGEACGQVSDCQPGFDCVSKICTAFPQVDTAGRAGSACMADDECNAGFCCGGQSVCRERLATFPNGPCGVGLGDPCGLSADCAPGLLCAGSGTCETPMAGAPGQAAAGEACDTTSDCQRPLLCAPDGRCVAPPALTPLPCRRSEDEIGAFRPYFELPRAEPVNEFYRLPFPNDVRIVDDRINLDGHAAPGEVGGIDISQRYYDAISGDVDGFGLTQPIFVRFSDTIDTNTLSVNTSTATLFLVDVDASSPSRGQRVKVQMVHILSKGQFMCGNAVAVAPRDGRPLRPRNQYALLVTDGVTSVRGDKPIPDGDFAPMLAVDAPAATVQARAHGLYEPMRAFVIAAGIDATTIVGGTVFTTGAPAEIGPKIHEAIAGAAAPELSDVTHCTGNAVSPCDEMDPDPDARSRACTSGAGFDILHATLSNHPKIQSGIRPYPDPGPSGTEGAIVLDAMGDVSVTGTEQLCVGIAVPRGNPPAGGWPVVIFAHGTGGNFKSGLDSPVASRIARDLRAVLITYDNVMHGPRQGLPVGARRDPGFAFFNATNPRAARDNVLQGGADLFFLRRLAAELDIPEATSGLSADITTNAERIGFYGHSQGTVVAPAFLAFETELRGAVLTGAGAEIGLTLISKEKPNDIAGALRVLFGDGTLTRLHPMIGLLSLFFGPSDAIPYAGLIADAPPAGRTALNFLHVYGVDDGFTPEVTQQALVRAGGYPVAGDLLRPIDGVNHTAGAVDDNFNGGTAAAVQYAPIPMGNDTPDGHFVGVNNPGAAATIDAFLGDALDGPGAATIRREDD